MHIRISAQPHNLMPYRLSNTRVQLGRGDKITSWYGGVWELSDRNSVAPLLTAVEANREGTVKKLL